ncbi:MAG: phospho-N-acetylmuramoyl-pentapeptide-transferase, partial [Cyanobacteria bacterium J06626_18]
MDAKFSSDKPIRPIALSGWTLLWVLSVGILAGSLVLDSLAGRLGQLQSLTFPLVFAGLGAAAAGLVVVPVLRALKTGQFIREEGPQAHFKKAGTPTMGGIFFVPVGVIVAIALSGLSQGVIAAGLLTLAYAFIGWLDDWQVLQRKSNKGISPRTKLALQIAFSVAFCLWVLGTQPIDLTTIALPLGISVPLG